MGKTSLSEYRLAVLKKIQERTVTEEDTKKLAFRQAYEYLKENEFVTELIIAGAVLTTKGYEALQVQAPVVSAESMSQVEKNRKRPKAIPEGATPVSSFDGVPLGYYIEEQDDVIGKIFNCWIYNKQKTAVPNGFSTNEKLVRTKILQSYNKLNDTQHVMSPMKHARGGNPSTRPQTKSSNNRVPART